MYKTTLRGMAGWVLGLLGIIVIPATAHALQAEEPANMTIVTTSADATLTVAPDEAQLEIGVVTQAPTASEAGTKNKLKLNAVITALRKQLGPQADIKTSSYSLNPSYHYPKEGGIPVIDGYKATNVLQVKVTQLNTIGSVIDTAVQAGANNINNLYFTLSDEQALRLKTLRTATLKAKARADVLVQALGLQSVRVLSISQEQSDFQPVRMMLPFGAMATMASSTPTPIAPGTLTVRAMVTLKVAAQPAPPAAH